uniref:Toxic anion resistance protein TelA n=1 Tax=Pseudomonas phage Cygsa01 TaxID=3138529 RepID=A0AAU6W3I3_9VIRU
MTSPLNRPAVNTQAAPAPVQMQSIMARSDSPLAKAAPTQSAMMSVPLIVEDSEIEQLGSAVGQLVGGVANKFTEINKKKMVSQYGDLGTMLTNMSMQVDLLDPSNILPKGLTGWVRGKFGDIKHLLIKRLNTAEQVFDGLVATMNNRIAVEDGWVKDYAALYIDNMNAYQQIVRDLNQAKLWETSMENTIRNLPAIDPADPDGIMKAQAHNQAKSRLSRLRGKIDGVLRMKAMAENNGPKITGMQEASQGTVDALREVLKTIPFIRMDFALYMGTLENKKSNEIVKMFRDMGNQTLVKTSESIAESMVNSAVVQTEASISNDTLFKIRSNILGAVTTVRKVHDQADTRRAADAILITESQKAYLADLTAQGAI